MPESADEPDLERGIELVRQLPEIMAEQAEAEVARVYEEVRTTLRVPFVNFVFRTLANYPDFLAAEWGRLRPWLRTRNFENAANEVRSSAILPFAQSDSDPDWSALGDLGRIRPFTESIHYVLPKLLLIVTAMQHRTPDPEAWHSASPGMNEIQLGVAFGTLALPMVDPTQASPEIRAIFDRIKERHGHPGVATYYRSLANWPGFLQSAWERIEPHLSTAEYAVAKRRLLRKAQDCIAPTDADVWQSVPADIRDVLAVFRLRIIPDLLLDVALVQSMLDRGEAAGTSWFSVA